MTAYDALLRIEGEDSSPVGVTVDLTEDRFVLSIGEEAVADWERSQIRVNALPDGFHIRAEGESLILDVEDDAHFALDLGLRNAHPILRRRMSALMREDRD